MIKLDCSEPKMTSKKAVEALARTAVKVIRGDVIGSAFGFYDVYKAYAPEKPTPYQSAYMFWRAVFFLAATDALTRNRLARMADEKVIEQQTDLLLKTVFDPKDPGSFDLGHLMEPTGWDLYRNSLRVRFPEFVGVLEPAPGFSEDELRHQLDLSLRASLYQVWEDDGFWEFRDFISSCRDDPVFESLMRRRKWRRHYAWIEHKLSGQTLFGQDEGSGITLRSVYTPLRCAWEIFEDLPRDPAGVPKTGDERGFKRQKRVVHIDWLEGALKIWLTSVSGSSGTDTLRVIAGGPGSGKSTVARIFAADVAQEDHVNVCFIELQHFNLAGDLRTSLAAELGHARDGVGLGGDPIAWQDEADNRPILFVFDGLDELVNRDRLDEDITHDFIQKVRNFLRDVNRGRVRALAVVTGRPGAVSTAFQKAHLDPEALFEVMPLTPLTGHRFLKKNSSGIPRGVVDHQSLLEKDFRRSFWRTWCKASRQTMDLPGALKVSELDEFTCEPLLFYLLTLSGHARNPEQASKNKNLIYRAIFTKVHDRDAKKREERGDEPIEAEQFFVLMECLALAIWHGGGRIGSDEKFEAIRDWHAGRQRNRLALLQAASLKNVALQFYTRNDTIGGDPGFEFIHKSFGEYLAACALARIGTVLAGSDDPEEEVAAKWLRRTGPAQVTPEIIGFLRDEVKLWPEDKTSSTKDALTELLNWVVIHGMPAHMDGVEGSWRDAETRQRNASGALLAVVNACVLATQDLQAVAINWPDETAARKFLDMLEVTSELSHPHGQLLAGLRFRFPSEETGKERRCDLSTVRLQHTDLREADLYGADLEGANLQETYLRGAYLRGADLREADLYGADLQGANLQEADLRWANLQVGDLRGAKLYSADLRGANLPEADLRGANLQQAYLRGADLEGANLRGADLRGANLQGADLLGANLEGANLLGADLLGANTSETNFQFVSLVSVLLETTENLTQRQINSAFGDVFTVDHLPDGLKPPGHWAKTELDAREVSDAWGAWIRERIAEAQAGENPTS